MRVFSWKALLDLDESVAMETSYHFLTEVTEYVVYFEMFSSVYECSLTKGVSSEGL